MSTHILAIDPGLKPGVAQFEVEGPTALPRLVRVSHKITEAWVSRSSPPWDVLATEGQWYYGGRGAGRAPDVNDLLKLAFRAGFTLASIPAVVRLRIPPQDWRGQASRLTKEQVQAHIAASLTPAERALFRDIPKSRHGDVLDAIGIGRRAALPDACEKFAWTI